MPVLFVVLVAKGDVSGVDGQEPRVGNGYPVSVTAQILEQGVGPDHRPFSEHIPLGFA